MAMQRGDRGPGVQLLQRSLNEWLRSHQAQFEHSDLRQIATDGAYGANTAYLVTLVQNEVAGLSSTGNACDATLERLDIPAGTRADGTAVVDSTGGGL